VRSRVPPGQEGPKREKGKAMGSNLAVAIDFWKKPDQDKAHTRSRSVRDTLHVIEGDGDLFNDVERGKSCFDCEDSGSGGGHSRPLIREVRPW
jgi:hypothetical protein